MNKTLEKLQATNNLTKNETVELLNNEEITSELFSLADNTRENNVGNKVHLRGLIEFSNVCSNNCLYCGLRLDNKNIERYNLSFDEILHSAQIAKELEYKTLVLQSGENQAYSIKEMQKIITELKLMGFAITLSLGEKSFEEYKSYKDAGADRYLLRIETTDKNLYKTMHPKMSLENRIRCLNDLKKLNYEVGSGFLVGLPNQTISSIADDLLFLKEIEVDMAGIGPFIPNPDTPLAIPSSYSEDDIQHNNLKRFTLSLKAMSIMRLLLPNINIPATTAMEALHPNGQIIALQCGANVIMPNVTDINFRKKYLLYPGKIAKESDAQNTLDNIKNKLQSINRFPSNDYGVSKAFISKNCKH